MASEHPQNLMSMSQPSSRPSTSHQQSMYTTGQKRPAPFFEEASYFAVPSNDNNAWYYPSLSHDSDEEDASTTATLGNWGRKTMKGARWVRKGKMAAWGPGIEDWEVCYATYCDTLWILKRRLDKAEDRARKRIKLLLPPEKRSPSPPTLPHLRSPPPLTAPYPMPSSQYLNYTSFVMNKAVTLSFRSHLLEDLERATNGLIEGESTMRRAFGRLWQVLSEDPDRPRTGNAVVPKREDEDEGNAGAGAGAEDEARRIARAPDLTPPVHKLFLVSYPNSGLPVFEPSHFAHPEMQMETLEKALATVRELQDDGREYVERLEEIRERLGDVRAQRDAVWKVRTSGGSDPAPTAPHCALAPPSRRTLACATSKQPLSTVTRAFFVSLSLTFANFCITISMTLPDVSALTLHEPGPNGVLPEELDDEFAHTTDRYLLKLRTYAKALPYSIETNSRMQQMLDFICTRIVQCVEAKDYDPGLLQWDSMLTYWYYLKYPIPKEKRMRIVLLYYSICTAPGMPLHIVATCTDALEVLTRSKKKLSVDDFRLPWRPLYDILVHDLFLTRRQFEVSQTSYYMGFAAGIVRRFFHPAAIDEMLATFVPKINGTSLDVRAPLLRSSRRPLVAPDRSSLFPQSLLVSQYFMLTFLPQSHPQSYLPMLFRLWESVNSYMYDERMLQFVASLAEMHVDPSVSDPAKIEEIPDDALSEGEGRPNWPKDDMKQGGLWTGLSKDVGIFTEYDWQFIMCKCLASMEIPLADSGSLTTGPSADSQAGFEIGRLPKPTWRIISLARIIVYSMAPDALPHAPSSAPTPFMTPLASGMNTPGVGTPRPSMNGNVGDYLCAHLGKMSLPSLKTYVGGSKALDSLIKLIASTESFFHPSNSGAWTADLSAFIKHVATLTFVALLSGWHEEQKDDCKTPMHRRLTRDMKRELVKCFRTVALLAMFSEDSVTVANISSCLKSLSLMEPDLIIYPVLERAVPSLEALVETERTIAVIKALGAVAPAMVSREIYYSGARHLVPILQLLIPGIDLNDPSKTLCTTMFLIEISQCIKFGDLTSVGSDMSADVDSRMPVSLDTSSGMNGIPAISAERMADGRCDSESDLTREQEDELLREATGGFPEWIASFIRRVIVLFDNLPEEAGGATEVQLVDAVTNACSQICIHLSDPLFDLVLNMIFDYASTNVRPNAVRAVHQLVECVANADPVKTLAKFLPFCVKNLYCELDNGASSLRTTSTLSTPLPSDATFHWNLAILRGALFNDGKEVLKYKDELLPLLHRLLDKTYAKRGFSWSGKLLSSLLLTLTHTYPIEDKFVNPAEWNSDEFRFNHHQHWGKLYTAEEVEVLWHVPDAEEIGFALQILKEIVEPTLRKLERLLAAGKSLHSSVWRNDFCRNLSFVRYAFSGTPTLVKETISGNDEKHIRETTDILNEIPEMIASIEPLNAGFALSDPKDPRCQYYKELRRRFGLFLHKASLSLRNQGEENTVDAVSILIQSIRTYMLEYGDSKDNYYTQLDRYGSELAYARQYAGQKAWPRALFVRRARLYHAARLRWNSIERRRGPVEDHLIDDVSEWAMWQYSTVREASQSLLDSLCSAYDGIRRRCLPRIYKALQPGTDDDRMKGALWTLNMSVFVKYAIADPTLAPELIKNLFGCQSNEKPSIQNCVASVSENGINSFVEPCYLVFAVDYAPLQQQIAEFKAFLSLGKKEALLVFQCVEKRKERIRLCNESLKKTTSIILDIARSSSTHWRYAIFAARCLRTLVRRDVPISGPHLRYFLDKTHDDHPSLRYYSQRAVMKSLRYIKLRTFARGPIDLIFERNNNPMKRKIAVTDPSHDFTARFLESFKKPIDLDSKDPEPIFVETAVAGWAAWSSTISGYAPPYPTKRVLKPWEMESQPAIAVIQDVAQDPKYWKSLETHFTAETHADTVTSDNIAVVKSIVQVLEDESFEPLQKLIEELIANTDQNKQRGAAEFLAGLLNGAKHWPMESQNRLWDWAMPLIKKALSQKIKTDTLPVWTSFLEYMFYNRDPRRHQALVDYLVKEFYGTDYNGESSLTAVKALSFYRAFYEEENWKFTAWADDAVRRVWPELSSEHDEVRLCISEFLAFVDKIKWKPQHSIPSAEVFVRECRTTSIDVDIMGIRASYHGQRVAELVQNFPRWRAERLPGARAFQSTYDRSNAELKGRDVVFDYILPLMPELTRFTEVNDDDELVSRSRLLLVRMCGVTPPRPLIDPILDAIFDAIQNSPVRDSFACIDAVMSADLWGPSQSWKVRLQALPLVQVFYFRQVPLISDAKITEILEVICKCLDDDVVEVREMAATTLSGILRLSPRRSLLKLKERFLRLLKRSSLPSRQSPVYNAAVRQRHAAILGICALVDSYPYTVERWMPELLTNVLAEHTYDPIPISTTVRKCASNFKKTHQDTWHEDSKRFTEDQLAALSTLLTGSSYYA
ncbi:hypothetical protein EW146_g1513 [Bondarzewia mesenterica]|uniref:Uncharacterized protein n=1 Tax=Bondarzewia mesenterica TaxID=1095465 RepID=A0A4S4M5G1_9AGAM|nr:hypothetical protein EW146_g1513 [Bondarzewia mesenterica]